MLKKLKKILNSILKQKNILPILAGIVLICLICKVGHNAGFVEGFVEGVEGGGKWEQCAVEGGTCKCKGTVRYGAPKSKTGGPGKWVVEKPGRKVGEIGCNNKQPWGDPLRGTKKVCQCMVGAQQRGERAFKAKFNPRAPRYNEFKKACYGKVRNYKQLEGLFRKHKGNWDKAIASCRGGGGPGKRVRNFKRRHRNSREFAWYKNIVNSKI